MSRLAASLLLAVVFAGLGLGFGRVLAPHLVSQAYRKPGDLPSRRPVSPAQGAGACVIGAGWVGGTTAASRPLLAAALLIVSVVAVWVSVVDLDVHRIPNRASGLAALTSFGYVGVDAAVSGQYGRAFLAFGAVIVVVAAGLGVAALGGAGLGDVKLLAALVPVPVYLGVAAIVLVCVVMAMVGLAGSALVLLRRSHRGLTRRRTWNERVPGGPAIAYGVLVGVSVWSLLGS